MLLFVVCMLLCSCNFLVRDILEIGMIFLINELVELKKVKCYCIEEINCFVFFKFNF